MQFDNETRYRCNVKTTTLKPEPVVTKLYISVSTLKNKTVSRKNLWCFKYATASNLHNTRCSYHIQNTETHKPIQLA